jgi:hypothetical protein
MDSCGSFSGVSLLMMIMMMMMMMVMMMTKQVL